MSEHNLLCVTEHWNWDTWTGEEREEDYGEEYDGEEYRAAEPYCEDQDFNVSLCSLLISCLMLIVLINSLSH